MDVSMAPDWEWFLRKGIVLIMTLLSIKRLVSQLKMRTKDLEDFIKSFDNHNFDWDNVDQDRSLTENIVMLLDLDSLNDIVEEESK